MTDLLKKLESDHVNIRQLLDLLEQEVEVENVALKPNLTLLLDIMQYATDYPDLFHHPREDALFACIVERDPSTGETVAALQQEHQALAQKGARLIDVIRNMINGVALKHGTLQQGAKDYTEFLRYHMAKEEQQIFARANELLTGADWASIEETVASREDPLFGQTVQSRYRGLRERIKKAS